MHDMPDVRIALFDLDRTITRYATFTPFLLGYVVRYRPWMLAAAPAVLGAFLAYRLGLTSRTKLKSFMLKLTVGAAPDHRLAAYAESFAEGMLSRQTYAGAKAAITAHKAAGARLVMATASFEFIAKPIGDCLGFDEIIATGAQITDGALVPKVLGENCYGAEKLRRVEEHFEAQGSSWDEVAFYSDHHTDIPLLERAGYPCPVNCSAKLDLWARQNGVLSIDWRSE